jgi:hypothetical protein
MKTIERLPEKYRNAITSVSDERNNGDGWWLYLKPPFWNPEMECRIIHETRLSDCVSILKNIVDKNITDL